MTEAEQNNGQLWFLSVSWIWTISCNWQPKTHCGWTKRIHHGCQWRNKVFSIVWPDRWPVTSTNNIRSDEPVYFMITIIWLFYYLLLPWFTTIRTDLRPTFHLFRALYLMYAWKMFLSGVIRISEDHACDAILVE